MLRRSFLWLSERRGVFEFIKRNTLARRIASRFVAGETVESAVAAAQQLNASGIAVSLDVLGESVTGMKTARTARNEVLETVDALGAHRLRGGVSIKLTQLGLEIDEALCVENVRCILARAGDRGVFVRVDMEARRIRSVPSRCSTITSTPNLVSEPAG